MSESVFFVVSAALYAAEWALAGRAPKAAAVVLYLHVLSLGALVSSGFWSVINERFDPYEAKRVIGRIGGGASQASTEASGKLKSRGMTPTMR